jgi:hypothetical protein
MKLSKYFKLKNQLEIKPFEQSFTTLSTVLYYFSFLGNLFLILSGFYFISTTTSSIPQTFEGQNIAIGIFIALFLTGYELFKRFSLEQLIISVLKSKKINISNFLGLIVCLALIAGSFYLSLNGSHRLIDNKESIVNTNESKQISALDSIAKPYNTKIAVYQNQLDKVLSKSDTNGTYNRNQRKIISKFESQIASLEKERDLKITKSDTLLKSKIISKEQTQLAKNAENDLAFVFMTFFLEFIILIGVGFHGYYTIGSYMEMKKLLSTKPQIEVRYKLLSFMYNNRKVGEAIPEKEDLLKIINLNNVKITEYQVDEFLEFITATGICKDKQINLNYKQAIKELESFILV